MKNLTFAVIAGLTACGRLQKTSQPPKNTKNSGLRLVDEAFSAQYSAILQGRGSETVLLRNYQRNQADSEISSSLDFRSGDSKLRTLEFGPGLVSSISFVDSNRIVGTFLDASSDEYGTRGLTVKLFNSANGAVEVEKKFGDFSFPCDDKDFSRFWTQQSAKVEAMNEKIFLLTYQCRTLRLTQLNTKLDILWSKEVSIQSNDFYGYPDLVVTKDQKIFTTIVLSPENVTAFNQKFSDSLIGIGAQDILVQVHNFEGVPLARTLVGTENFESEGSLAVSDNAVFVGFDSKVARPYSANTVQSDLVIASLSRDKLTRNWQKQMDIQDEDTITSISVLNDDTIALGGSTGAHQVATGSVVKAGDALISIWKANGEFVCHKIFGTPRNDRVLSLLALDGGIRVFAAGYENGPITHDTDTDKSRGYRSSISTELELKSCSKS